MVLVATVWDDGLVSDLPLLKILEKYSATASFALSPGVYGPTETPNDYRDMKYGQRVSLQQLSRYRPYDICNHGLTHIRLDTARPATIRHEIGAAKKLLESIFDREVTGIVYPYGQCGASAESVAAETGHAYARVNPTGNPAHHITNRWRVTPTAKWNHSDVPHLIARANKVGGYVLLSGHTYEMKSSADWERVNRLYRTLTTSPEVRLVSMSKLVKEVLS